MVSLWHKFLRLNTRKKQTLYSLITGIAFFALLYLVTFVIGWETICPFKRFFGISCFGCGMTRGFVSIIRLDFMSAYEYNVLSVPIFIGIVVYFILAVVDVIYNVNYIEKIERFLAKRYMTLIYLSIMVVAYVANNM